MNLTGDEIANLLQSMRDSIYLRDSRWTIECWWYLSGYLWVGGLWRQFRRCKELALEACRDLLRSRQSSRQRTTVRRLQSLILSELAMLEMELGRLAEAEAYALQSEELAQDIGDWIHLARVKRYHAAIKFHMAQEDSGFREALDLADGALAALAQYQEPAQQCLPPVNQALTDLLGRPLELQVERGGYGTDQVSMAATRQQVHYLRFSVLLRKQDFQSAWQELEQARIEIEQDLRLYQYWQVTWPRHLGVWHQRQGHLAEARAAYQEWLRRASAAGRLDMEGGARLQLAELAREMGDHREAKDQALSAIEIFQTLGKAAEIRRARTLLRCLK